MDRFDGTALSSIKSWVRYRVFSKTWHKPHTPTLNWPERTHDHREFYIVPNPVEAKGVLGVVRP